MIQGQRDHMQVLLGDREGFDLWVSHSRSKREVVYLILREEHEVAPPTDSCVNAMTTALVPLMLRGIASHPCRTCSSRWTSMSIAIMVAH
jgi:hypothetical protein